MTAGTKGDDAKPHGTYLDGALDALAAGARYTAAGEVIRFLSANSNGTQRFIHEHPKYQTWDKQTVRSGRWVRERLAWLALHRPKRLLSFLRQHAAGATDLDAESMVSHLEEHEAEVMRLARIELRQEDLAGFLADGLWAGASFSICNSGGGETWKRCGDRVHWDSSECGPDGGRVLTRKELAVEFRWWGDIVHGFVVPSNSFSLALDMSLWALKAPSVRAYLDRSRPS
jgi:hypothetical protein